MLCGSSAGGPFTLLNLWFIFCCYWPVSREERVGCPQQPFPPGSTNTSCPAMKLTLAWRLGGEISPNRCDKNPIPWAAMGRVVREQPWGQWRQPGFYHPLAASGERHAESLIAARLPTCSPILPVWRIKIHELRWFECQGLWQRSPSASVLWDEHWERLENDRGREIWDQEGKRVRERDTEDRRR